MSRDLANTPPVAGALLAPDLQLDIELTHSRRERLGDLPALLECQAVAPQDELMRTDYLDDNHK